MKSQFTPLRFGIGVAILAMLLAAYISGSYTLRAGASAPPGLQADMLNATSSSATLAATTATLLFATTTGSCSARVISTGASAIKLTFTDNKGQRPTGIYGHVQIASTTVAYDSGLFGCGAVYGYSYAAQALDLTESR